MKSKKVKKEIVWTDDLRRIKHSLIYQRTLSRWFHRQLKIVYIACDVAQVKRDIQATQKRLKELNAEFKKLVEQQQKEGNQS